MKHDESEAPETVSPMCSQCGHQHQGRRLAYICIGCPCPEEPGKVSAATDGADETAISEALKSAERYAGWSRAYDDGLGRPIDREQEEVITLAAEVRRLRELHTSVLTDRDALVAVRDGLRAKLARVEALLDMQHDDSLIAVSDIRRALRGEP